MLAILAAAVVVAVTGERPAVLLGADGLDGYAAALAQKLDTPAVQQLIAQQLPDCAALTYTAKDYREITDQDTGSLDGFYQQVAQKPAIIEHIKVSGCGQDMQINLAAMRRLADPALTVSFQFPGETQAGLILQRDAYLYADVAAGLARKMAGETTPCTQSSMIYNTRIVVPFQGSAPYKEIWYASKCGFKVRIAMDFLPKPEGGTRIGTHAMRPDE